MITAIDTNILVDILLPDPSHAVTSKILLDNAYEQGALIISEVVFAELAAGFLSQDELDEFLRRTRIKLVQSQTEALHSAGEAWLTYTSGRGQRLQCSRCGRTQKVTCPACGNTIQARQHILADFLIGGHALAQADRLLTRDRGYYRSYFPALRLQQGV